jgi:hypothetical protein
MQVAPGASGSEVHVETDLHVSGGIAQIGRGMIEEVGQELMDEFAVALGTGGAARAAPPEGPASAVPPAEPFRANRVIARVLMRRMRRLLRLGR